MAVEPIVSPDGIFATWGFIQWAITGAVAALVAIGTLIWRLGSKVGTYQSEFAAMRIEIDSKHKENTERSMHFDVEIAKLRENDRTLERTVAGLPDAIMVRLEVSLQAMTRRIDDALQRPRPH